MRDKGQELKSGTLPDVPGQLSGTYERHSQKQLPSQNHLHWLSPSLLSMERVNELFRSRQQQQYSRTFRSEDLHQLVTQLNTDYSTTSLYRKNDVMGDSLTLSI